MIIKQCQFSGVGEQGPLVHLLHAGYSNDHLVKQASMSAPLLDEVQHYMKNMHKREGVLHTLVSALGAGEYWGSNSNGDFFPESSLIHTPPDWKNLSHEMQKMVGPKWEWGYPTFYNAHAFQHHVNKDPERAFGEVEHVCWDPCMKRVLLVVGIDRARASRMGADSVVDRIENGEFPDVSMGCRVPYDVCSVCGDWSRITCNKHKDLAENRRSPIRGLSVTTHDYCQHLQFEIGKVYPDGRRVWMWNIHPRFFDISFVYIGADKASKVMAKLGSSCPIRPGHKKCSSCYDCDIPSHHVYEVWSKEKTSERAERSGAVAVSTKPNKKPRRVMFWDGLTPDGKRTGGAIYEGTPEWDAHHKNTPTPAFTVKGGKTTWHTKKPLEKRSEMPDTDPRVEAELSRYFRAKTKTGSSIHEKIASLPLHKQAEIIKRIRSHFNSSLRGVDSQEPDIPKDVLERMGGRLSDSLSTAGSLGIVMKPREFQRSYLCAIGRKPMADDLDNMGIEFKRGLPPEDDFRLSGSIIPHILKSLAPMMQSRSAFGPVLHRRMLKITVSKSGEPTRTIVMNTGPRPVGRVERHPLLDKIGGAYSNYRRQLLYKTASLVPRALHEHPELLEEILQGEFSSGSLVKTGSNVVQSILGMFPVSYLNRAYLPEPASGYVEGHCNLGGLQASLEFAERGGVA